MRPEEIQRPGAIERPEETERPGETGRPPVGQRHAESAEAAEAALAHPVRAALMELVTARGTLTSAEAARELGGSTGLYSFHLRQLARYGLIEEAPAVRGRVRPWRVASAPTAPDPAVEADLDGLEDESYRRWLAQRDRVPAHWRRDEAFSQVLYLTPEELTEMGDAIRRLIAGYRQREERPVTRPPGAAPVAVVARLFPLLEPGPEQLGPEQPGPEQPGPEQPGSSIPGA